MRAQLLQGTSPVARVRRGAEPERAIAPVIAGAAGLIAVAGAKATFSGLRGKLNARPTHITVAPLRQDIVGAAVDAHEAIALVKIPSRLGRWATAAAYAGGAILGAGGLGAMAASLPGLGDEDPDDVVPTLLKGGMALGALVGLMHGAAANDVIAAGKWAIIGTVLGGVMGAVAGSAYVGAASLK